MILRAGLSHTLLWLLATVQTSRPILPLDSDDVARQHTST